MPRIRDALITRADRAILEAVEARAVVAATIAALRIASEQMIDRVQRSVLRPGRSRNRPR
jgi:chorismate mutase